MGVGGRIGNGRQWMPWVHRDDVVGLAMWAGETPEASGPVNAVAPEAIRSAEFTSKLGRLLKRPTWLPMPGFALRGIFGELGTVMTASQRVIPTAATRAGYPFRFADLDEALPDAVGALGR
jgi:NAD dependent epimerase/dehydratase family enzyme